MEEACNYLGVTRPTILEWIKAKGFLRRRLADLGDSKHRK